MKVLPGLIALLGSLVPCTFASTVTDGGRAYTPAKGNPERQAIMDAAREVYLKGYKPAERAKLGLVLCEVSHLKVHGDWALTCVQPVKPDGSKAFEFQWLLFQRKKQKWVNADYFDQIIKHYPHDDDGLDALDLTDSAIRFTWQEFPSTPHDIFPPLGSRGRFFSTH